MVIVPGTVVAGRYRIVRELGRGGMGSVYVAEHVNTGGRWALKVMHGNDHLGADRAARFRREARASSRITSENVVRVTDADVAAELEGAPFIVMELLDGEDLDHLLAAKKKLTPQETIDILSGVARGLDKAHAAGVVHRDLKPENVFLHRRDDGSVVAKVVDFGISKVLRPEDDPSLMSVTSSGEIMGTPLYMAPEQARARADEIGPGTDVWAIGLMAYRMLSGENYWIADTIANLFFQILTEEKPAPSSKCPTLDAAFDAWFAKSCAILPKDRFVSVGEQVAELSQAVLGRRVVPAGPTPQKLEAPVAPPGASVTAPLLSPSRLPSSDHSVPGTDSSLPTSTGVTASVPVAARASRTRVVVAAVGVLGLVVAASAVRMRSQDPPAPAAPVSAVAPPVSPSAPAAEVSSAPLALAPLPATSVAPSASIATSAAPVSPASPGAKPGSVAHPRPSASAAPSAAPVKPHDLFDTQK